ncbi:N-acetylmuramoyl-L-alanine amidase [Methylopila jiangsuensis]|uniref:N-acetylmuramoyl-L-alanine amidase n=1 Tax=Methylopila jiangsuensis TaxID=586230 RepID=A0A9W6JEI3_9HYPH|nr:N-acetylmuramoyl-L-alanine amidase [Methylopila jiangsuensis]MDR6286361.1 N-acetylmuramoyl-L-alanine amidase [Methylopila jiangsuensis]GLK76125.1 N-acetylmuramoyl-L-alanine amidase [Methylopila jiangsuensis]
MIRLLILALAVAGGLWTGAPARAGEAGARATPVATDGRLAGDDERTRLVIDLTAATPIRAFALADPYRVVIDLPEVTFRLPEKAGEQGRGLIAAYRYGMFAPGRSRIVVDVIRPVAIDKAFVLEPVEGQPARLVLDLTPTDRKSFLRTIAQAPAQDITGATPAPKVETAHGLPIVVIDPGHGGVDPGAAGPGDVSEKDIVLAFARRLKEKLEASGERKVVLTRDDDSFISLPDRVKVAREHAAALMISIHADTLSNPFGVRGATVYTLSDKASDREAERLAEKENRADLIAGLDLSDEPDEVAGILFDLTMRETRGFTADFARRLVKDLKTAATLNKNPLRSAGFRVLKAPDVPSVLLELGYLSSKEDAKQLMSEAWRDKATDAVAKAVDGYFETRVAAGSPGRLN